MVDPVLLLIDVILLQMSACDVMDRLFSGRACTQHTSPYSSQEVTHPQLLICADKCAADPTCIMFSYNSVSMGCIFSGRNDTDSLNYDTANSSWVTYYTMCPSNKGYVQYNNQEPPLCLLHVDEELPQEEAAQRCQQDGARLVRVKTWEIYSVVESILNEVGTLTDWIWVGADDKRVEGEFEWNDKTRLRQGTTMWRAPTDGYNKDKDCVCISGVSRLVDCFCEEPKTFICQYDI